MPDLFPIRWHYESFYRDQGGEINVRGSDDLRFLASVEPLIVGVDTCNDDGSLPYTRHLIITRLLPSPEVWP